MTKNKYEFNPIDWTEKGYFGCQNINNEFPTNPNKKPWYSILIAIYKAKQGNFYNVNRLLEITNQEISETLDKVCTQVFGDIGSDTCFQELIKRIRADKNYEFTFQACEALSTRGLLCDIPVLLDALDSNKAIRDSQIIPIFINQMLDPEDYSLLADPKVEGLKKYRKIIENHTMMLSDKYGSDDIYIWRGKILSIERIALYTIKTASEKARFFPIDVRRRLEAISGINCSQFYHNHTFQPLAAMAIAEQILDSNLVEKLKPNTRYFFGHRIPSF